jgi:hypothetical protein
LIVALPGVLAVKDAKHTPLEGRLQLAGEKVPETPVTVKVTVPEGVELPEPLVSMINATQNAGWLTAIELGMHPTKVEVVRVPSVTTVRVMVVGVVVAPRGEPVTWKLYEPGVTEDATLIVKSLVAPGEEGITGLKVKDPQVMPEGRDALTHDNVTGCTVPEIRVAVIVATAGLPGGVVTGPLFDIE